MGTGSHGGFGSTKGSSGYKNFTPVKFEGSVKVSGEVRDVSRKVYQRNDIDFDRKDKYGHTNLERMQKGFAPIGNDGEPVQLHHVIQKENGPVVEVREITHKEYYRILHGLGGKGLSFRNDPVLDKQFNNFRSLYWKWRAKEHIKKGGKR